VRISSERIPLVLYGPPAPQAEQDCACGSEGLAPVTLYSESGEQIETDCACPETGPLATIKPFADPAACWQRSSHVYHSQIDKAHEVVFNPDNPQRIAVLNQPARRILESFANPTTFNRIARRFQDITPSRMRDTVHDLAALNLIQPVTSSHFSAVDPMTLNAWLHITNACNLNCSYCYVRKTDEAMDETTGKAAIEAVFRSALAHDFSAVKLKYAGGEPTLNFDLVRVLHHHAQALADGTGLHLSEVLLTNGVALTPTILDFVRDADIRLCISLDGVGAAHDAQRRFCNGRGSFALVAQSIDRALACSVHPYLSITVTARNVDGLAEAVSFALDRDLLFNLNFYRQCDAKAAQNDLHMEDDRLIAAIQRTLAVVEARLPRHSSIGALLDRANFGVPHAYPCGTGRSYLVVNQRGQIACCQMDIANPVTDIHAQDPLAAIRQTGRFKNPSVEEKADCQRCPWRYWCAGGCPRLTYRATGHYDARSPSCRIYQALFPEIVRLEGLRLLKWH
jgi:uncharacterized protein